MALRVAAAAFVPRPRPGSGCACCGQQVDSPAAAVSSIERRVTSITGQRSRSNKRRARTDLLAHGLALHIGALALLVAGSTGGCGGSDTRRSGDTVKPTTISGRLQVEQLRSGSGAPGTIGTLAARMPPLRQVDAGRRLGGAAHPHQHHVRPVSRSGACRGRRHGPWRSPGRRCAGNSRRPAHAAPPTRVGHLRRRGSGLWLDDQGIQRRDARRLQLAAALPPAPCAGPDRRWCAAPRRARPRSRRSTRSSCRWPNGPAA